MSNELDYSSEKKPTWRDTYGWPLGILGALCGGAAGTCIYVVMRAQLAGILPQHEPTWYDGVRKGFPFIIGVMVGFGGRAISNKGGPVMALLAVEVALLGSVIGEWLAAPFRADSSLTYFVMHLQGLPHLTIGLHIAGALVAGWIAWSAPKRG